MRGIAVVVTVTFGIIIVMMVAGPVLEPVNDVVGDNDAVEKQGWDSIGDRTVSVIMRYVPMIAIAGVLVWALRWYLRRERLSGVRR